MSEQYDKKIGQSELEKLGIKIDKPKEQTKSFPSQVFQSDNDEQVSLFDDDLNEIPSFLDRRPTKKRTQASQPGPALHRRTEVVTARKNKWTDDDLCREMEELRENFEIDEHTCYVPKNDLNRIAYLLKTNMGNIIEHGGFIYKSGESAMILQDLLYDFIKNQCLSHKEDEYFEIKVQSDEDIREKVEADIEDDIIEEEKRLKDRDDEVSWNR
tara:strand:- start:11203 stop:11841 length:639 start_codon:yes stop_codon:yes gene_type:complete